jgi:H+-transporting ATPase
MVWGYALAWFLLTDPVKLLAYRVLGGAKDEPRPRSQPASTAKPAGGFQPEPKAKVVAPSAERPKVPA